ncbi:MULTISPECIES: tripartite tricarboxylate transporter substrate binding protein [unclassified Beijerinckia]|uniref:Bug family tripartite tricarboxylate transporter substrate binding protein n=1 Tax=unclassified Beijerinckia TaxID=2638183 RepID=UPI00089B65D8|nr:MULTISPECIES: tripartite tricarboxylate transporter substrate binding protein [unclassified Beijerinckia]MDH7797188.1 tripartite-type tricarboxylate transporter receptor subunit TctC [Beijerinckia sp. GAS462]SEC75713.1 Tripartite-type tricarboxylate transporter, receptor component TctC [Beijerinckia sp. 28-YEA-48]
MSFGAKSAFLAMAICGWSGSALAQDVYPARPITLVVAYPAGGGADITARVGTPFLEKYLGQSIVVENIGGASGAIGAMKVATATPDGYTLLFGTTNEMIVTPLVNPATKYRVADFEPVALIARSTAILFGRTGLPANSLDELIEYGRANPDGLSLAHPGAGTFQYLAAVLAMQKAGLKVRYVAYRGAAPLLQDIGAGHVDLAVAVLASVDQQLNTGQMKAFGVLRAERDPLRPQTPTVNEGKYLKGIDASFWTALFAPKGTPKAIVDKLNAAVMAMNVDPATLELRKTSMETPAAASSPQAFGQFLKQETDTLTAVVAAAHAATTETPR